MSPLAILTMSIVLAIVWGGFFFALRLALRRDREGRR